MEISASYKTQTPFYAIIAAAGSGERYGGQTPKQYQKLHGKAILRHTIEAFLSCEGLQGLQVIINPEHRGLYDEAVKGLNLVDPIDGGNTRTSSIYNGLKAFSHLNSQDIILIHDAARPFIKPEEIMAVAMHTQKERAATLALAVSDTQKYSGGEYVKRENLFSIQTPQGFEYGLIKKAHESANDNQQYTDDSAMVEALGHKVYFVPGNRANIKITTPEDIDLAKRLMEARQVETRTGFGYDVHAFETGDFVRLCGIDIPFHKKLKGHSDADAPMHALTDALLGTIGAGDIGDLFPPSDPQWKDANSSIFLKEAIERVQAKGGQISNLDITIICEEPKIGPHRAEMQRRLALLCALPIERVGIKATTNEKLGFIGRGEGIAAQAVVSVTFPLELF